MEVLPVTGKDILNRLGIIKNECLVFVVIVCLILNGSAYGLDRSAERVQQSGGLIMHLSSVAIVLFGLAFYIYAYLHLPSSTQELVFVKEAQTIGKEHETRRRKNAKPVKNDA